MAKREGKRIGEQKQKQAQIQIQLTEQRRLGMEELETWRESAMLPGAASRSNDLGYDDEADGDDLIDDGDDAGSGEPGASDAFELEEPEEEPDAQRLYTTADLLGSRPSTVLLRVSAAGDELSVRICAKPSAKLAQTVELLRDFVHKCFKNGRSSFSDLEWAQLLGRKPAPLTARLLLLSRLAIKANEKIELGNDGDARSGAAFTPHDIGLERFGNKFAALPDGTPFSIRLLLLDQRGRDSDHFFDQLPDTVKLLALRRALQRESAQGVAVDDNEFRNDIQQALEELLGVSAPKPTEDQIRRRLRDNFKRKGLGDLFPNQKTRQREYDRLKAESSTKSSEDSPPSDEAHGS